MAIGTVPIKDTDGTSKDGVACWFVLNDHQQFVVLGVDDPRSIDTADNYENGVLAQHMGRLHEQGFVFKSQIINSLNIEGWDFERFDNPNIILLTKTDNP